MSMTREEKIAKNEILNILARSGYPTYANILDDFDVNLTRDPGVVGYMEPNKGKIVLNRGLDLDQVSTIVRHEILHQYLEHEKRLLTRLAKNKNLNFDDLDDLSLKELKRELYSNKDYNIAADYEISNRGYTDKDKDIIRNIKLNGQILTGLVTEDEHPDWVDMSVEDMYDELKKLRKQDSQMDVDNDEEEVIIVGEFIDETSFVDENNTMWGAGSLKDALEKRNQSALQDELKKLADKLFKDNNLTSDQIKQLKDKLKEQAKGNAVVSKAIDDLFSNVNPVDSTKIVTIVQDSGRLRAKANDGVHGEAFVTFPNKLRTKEGQQYKVDELNWYGKHYRVSGNIEAI